MIHSSKPCFLVSWRRSICNYPMFPTESLLCLKKWSSQFSLRCSVRLQFRFEKWLLRAFSGVHALFRDLLPARKDRRQSQRNWSKRFRFACVVFELRLASFSSYGPPNGCIGCRHKLVSALPPKFSEWKDIPFFPS